MDSKQELTDSKQEALNIAFYGIGNMGKALIDGLDTHYNRINFFLLDKDKNQLLEFAEKKRNQILESVRRREKTDRRKEATAKLKVRKNLRRERRVNAQHKYICLGINENFSVKKFSDVASQKGYEEVDIIVICVKPKHFHRNEEVVKNFGANLSANIPQ